MRILLIHNLYPPAHMGGYGIACQRMVEALIERGHAVNVITTNYNSTITPSTSYVQRCLLPSNFRVLTSDRSLLAREYWNNHIVSRFLRNQSPDIVSIWSMAGISISTLATIYKSQTPVSFYFHDSWFVSALETDPWLTFWARTPKSVSRKAGKALLKFAQLEKTLSYWMPTQLIIRKNELAPNSLFVSRSCRDEYVQAGFPVQDSEILYNGLADHYFSSAKHFPVKETVKLLYVGHIQPGKGLHILIDSMEQLRALDVLNVKLTVIGPVLDQNYHTMIQDKIAVNHLNDSIQFLGQVSPEDVRNKYPDYHMFIFPSVDTERFPITILEAMASGLPVITTLTGGHREILVDGVNCLVSPVGDSTTLAKQIQLLMENSEMRTQLATQGQSFVKEHFRLTDMAARFEKHLQSVIEREVIEI